MDEHQKRIEAQVAELKAETKQLKEEKETAIRKNAITPSINNSSGKIFSAIWKNNMQIRNRIT